MRQTLARLRGEWWLGEPKTRHSRRAIAITPATRRLLARPPPPHGRGAAASGIRLSDETLIFCDVHLSNLIPHGVYTVWNVTFGDAGLHRCIRRQRQSGQPDRRRPGWTERRQPQRVPCLGIGTRFHLHHHPAGELGTVGNIGAGALTDEFEWHVLELYHIDGQSHGPSLGPAGTMAEQFAFVFRNDQ